MLIDVVGIELLNLVLEVNMKVWIDDNIFDMIENWFFEFDVCYWIL